MITITNTSKDFTEIEQYLMTLDQGITSVKDLPDGEIITVAGYLEFEDVKETTGEVVKVLSIITPENTCYACQSQTFKRSLKDIANIMHGNEFAIEKISGKTKAGRDYINCKLHIA